MIDLGRYARTVRHLEPQQVLWRIVHEVRRRIYSRMPRLASATISIPASVRLCAPEANKVGRDPFDRELAIAANWRAGMVRYLALDGDRNDWYAPDRPKLWRYEHHYHSELLALAAASRLDPAGRWDEDARSLLRSWTAACPPGTEDAWDSYPVSRRIINWSLSAFLAPGLSPDLAEPLSAHVRFLASHLERHLGGNHLLTNGIALLIGTALLEPEHHDARAIGARVTERELRRQVLPDGGYVERTVQYHAIVLRDLLVSLAFARRRGRSVPASMEATAKRMANWLRAVVRPTGSVPLLNDAAPDAIPPIGDILGLAATLGLIDGPGEGWMAHAFFSATGTSAHGDTPRLASELVLRDTGWIIVRDGESELLFEHGPIGPDEQPGHGHSDGLSYELIWNRTPIVVDTGITTYDVGEVRAYERSVQAHASVSVDACGPDEPWASFRVGGRARVGGGTLNRGSVAWSLEGSLVGWRGWTHRRRMCFWPSAALVVDDQVLGASDGAQIVSHVPLGPTVRFDGEAELEFDGGALKLVVLSGSLVGVERGWVGQGFGIRQSRDCLALRADQRGRCAYALLAPDVHSQRTGGGVQLRRGDVRVECRLF
jgi:hypothetical protein